MDMTAILAMWAGPFEEPFVLQPIEGLCETWLIGPVVSEEMFKKSVDDDDGRATEAYLSYKLTNEPSAQVS